MFYVYGCYCSFNCAVSHLFYRCDISNQEKWDSYNLLHLLQKKMLGQSGKETNKIKLANPQETLDIFGGPFSITKFRENSKDIISHIITNTDNNLENINQNVSYKILYPPIISLIPMIEERKHTDEINPSYQSTPKNNETIQPKENIPKDNYITLNKNKPNLKIERKKPLLNKEHTLFNYMNLTIEKPVSV